MARQKERIYLPAGFGGLIRYGEEEESKFKLKPIQLIYFSIALGILLLIAKFFI